MALLGGGPAAFEQPGGKRQPEAACGRAGNDRRLVEAALEIARAVQRHRYHEVGPGRAENAPVAREQHAEQPPAGGLAVELERTHAMVDRVVVAIGRDEQRPGHPARGRVQEGFRRLRRQFAIALRAQVERAARGIEAPGGAAQRAGGWQAQGLDADQVARDCRLERLAQVDSGSGPREHAASLAAPGRRVSLIFLPL